MRYFIALDKMSLDELEVWRLLCKRSDYETSEAGYTINQLVLNSDKRLNLTTKKVRTILKNFEQRGYIQVLRIGRSGKESTLKLTIKEQLFNNLSTNKSEDFHSLNKDIEANQQLPSKPKKANKKVYNPTSNEFQLAKYLYDLIQKNNPKAKEPNFQTWARHIDLMIRIDNRTVEEIRKVIEYCQTDTFWHSNILSTKKLRDKFDTLYLKLIEKEKAPAKTSAYKNNYRNNSICNSRSSNTEIMEFVNNFA